MLISNYGLFWKRERVHWSYQGGGQSHLKGVRSTSKTSDPVDFAEQIGVYVLYDDNFQIVYLGQVGSKDQRLLARLKQHRTDRIADRWSRFSWFGVRRALKSGKLANEKTTAHVPISDVLNHIEAIMIEAVEPPRNRQGGRFGDRVEQYLQYSDPDEVGYDLREMVEDLFYRQQK